MVSQRQECTTVFGIPDSEIYILPDQKINRVLCQEYSGYPFEYGEQVRISICYNNTPVPRMSVCMLVTCKGDFGV